MSTSETDAISLWPASTLTSMWTVSTSREIGAENAKMGHLLSVKKRYCEILGVTEGIKELNLFRPVASVIGAGE